MQLKTPAEAVAELHISRRTLSGFVAQKQIGHVRLGRRLFFTAEDLEDFLASRHVSREPDPARHGGRA